MKIIIITQGVSRIVFPLIASKYEVVGIIEAAGRGRKRREKNNIKQIKSVIKKVLFFDRGLCPLKSLCEKNRIEYHFMTNSDDKGLESWISKKNPDLIVVYSMSKILKSNIFEIPRYGTINLHPSYLPDYRGPNPDFWYYYHMDLNPGVTVHYIDKGEDTGDIIYQERIHIPLGIKSLDRIDCLISQTGVNLLLRALDAIAQDRAPRIKQVERSPTRRARNLNEDEHNDIIDWNHWPIERIWHVLRGTESWLNALPPPSGSGRWVFGEYEKCDMLNYSPSRVYTECRRSFVATQNGKIYVAVKPV